MAADGPPRAALPPAPCCAASAGRVESHKTRDAQKATTKTVEGRGPVAGDAHAIKVSRDTRAHHREHGQHDSVRPANAPPLPLAGWRGQRKTALNIA